MKILLLPLALWMIPQWADACTCAFPEFDEQMKTATAVFTGEVIGIESQDNDQQKVHFRVFRIWKGELEKTTSTVTEQQTASCGYPFRRERDYLVFATGEETLHVSLCSRTKQLSDAKEDLNRLEEQFEKTDGKSNRDPFTENKSDQIVMQKHVPKELNITHAVVVGITKKESTFVVLIRATNNKVYFLKVGDKLHDGVVLKIDQNSVTFRQLKGSRSVIVRKLLRPFPDE
jgi:hypothetical protein